MGEHEDSGSLTADQDRIIADQDLIMMAVVDEEPIPTNAIDRLPPFRAWLVGRVAILAGGRLEHGTPEQFYEAAVDSGRRDSGQLGWWRSALGLPPQPDLAPAEPYVPPTNPPALPAGWSYASGEGGTRTREGR